MYYYRTKTDPETGERYLPVQHKGRTLLRDPMLNKGTAFSLEERAELGIQGLSPPTVCTIERQLERVYENYLRQPDDLSRYVYLVALQDRNETLFYRLLVQHVEEMTPIVYTPTVGLACERFSHIYRQPRGLYITRDDTNRMRDVLSNAPYSNVSVIVATDNESILGIGDQGAGGMGIPIGKLALYTMGAGIHPARCLPVCLDVGTGNPQLRSDPLYLGVQGPRLQGDEYGALIDAFVEGVAEVFPDTLLQWEDFSRQNAWTVLERHRDRICSFNDDIQGTGAMTVAGVLGVCSITSRALADHRFTVFGAGAGGSGIIHMLLAALEDGGLTSAQARERVLAVDVNGLILTDSLGLEDFQKAFAANPDLVSDWRLDDGNRIKLADVIRNFRSSVLIGTSGQGGSFTETMIREMAAHVERPAIFALSNPTAKTEVHPADAIAWTAGRAIVATGSPFDPVEHERVRHRIGQGNNVFCFPGVGLGIIASGAQRVTERMLLAAARAVAGEVSENDLAAGCVYPEMGSLGAISRAVAKAVVQAAIEEGLTDDPEGYVDPESIARRVDAEIWYPDYLPYYLEPQN